MTDASFRAAVKRYQEELLRVDPEQEDGILGASVNQDARAAVDGGVRAAASALLDAGRACGMDTTGW